MNRFFERMQRFGKSFSARRSQGEIAVKPPPVAEPRTNGISDLISDEAGALERRVLGASAARGEAPSRRPALDRLVAERFVEPGFDSRRGDGVVEHLAERDPRSVSARPPH